MNQKRRSALRRAKKTRMRIREMQVKHPDLLRLSVHVTPNHTYAQVNSENVLAKTSHVVVSASTLEKSVAEQCGHTGNVAAAKVIGKVVAERLLQKYASNLPGLAFDRSGFRYHGRVKALADAARENGLDF